MYHLVIFLHMRPANQHAITYVVLCRKDLQATCRALFSKWVPRNPRGIRKEVSGVLIDENA
jgi:hypothetical protein